MFKLILKNAAIIIYYHLERNVIDIDAQITMINKKKISRIQNGGRLGRALLLNFYFCKIL